MQNNWWILAFEFESNLNEAWGIRSKQWIIKTGEKESADNAAKKSWKKGPKDTRHSEYVQVGRMFIEEIEN